MSAFSSASRRSLEGAAESAETYMSTPWREEANQGGNRCVLCKLVEILPGEGGNS